VLLSRRPVTISPGMTAPRIAPTVRARRGEKQYSAPIQAEIKRGEAGFYVKRRENIKAPMSPEELEARVLQLLRITPEPLRVMQASTAMNNARTRIAGTAVLREFAAVDREE